MADVTERASILIVDDSPEKIVALESILDELGQDIVKATSGREALRHLLTRDFAVILLDVRMPMMDGFETAALIRQRARSEHTPIIFVTAFPDETHVARGYSLKAVDYIFTPVVPEVLRTKVSVFVDLYRMTAQVRRQADSLRQRAAQLHRLSAASLAINGATSLEQMLEVVVENARAIFGVPRAVATARVDDRRVLQAVSSAFETSDADQREATVSHELRTPLSAMLSWVWMLRRGALDGAGASRAIEAIERNVKTQTRIVEDLLDLSRIVTGKLRLESRLVELGPVIKMATDAITPAAEAKG